MYVHVSHWNILDATSIEIKQLFPSLIVQICIYTYISPTNLVPLVSHKPQLLIIYIGINDLQNP